MRVTVTGSFSVSGQTLRQISLDYDLRYGTIGTLAYFYVNPNPNFPLRCLFSHQKLRVNSSQVYWIIKAYLALVGCPPFLFCPRGLVFPSVGTFTSSSFIFIPKIAYICIVSLSPSKDTHMQNNPQLCELGVYGSIIFENLRVQSIVLLVGLKILIFHRIILQEPRWSSTHYYAAVQNLEEMDSTLWNSTQKNHTKKKATLLAQ